MIEITLIRHALAEINLADKDIIKGRCAESPLIKLGIEQARLLGDRFNLERKNFDIVYSSPLVRAYDTAKIVCPYIGYPLDRIILVDDLTEISFGDLDGKKWSDIPNDEIRKRELLGYDYVWPNGESKRDVAIRLSRWFNEELFSEENLRKAHNKKLEIAAFTHNYIINTLLRLILKTPQGSNIFDIENTSLTQINYDSSLVIHKVNDYSHLV